LTPRATAPTLAHELTHWTAHPSRLARELGQALSATRAYAAEELIAEMGSAFVSADLGITPEVREDHAQYLGHWLAVPQERSPGDFTAAAEATACRRLPGTACSRSSCRSPTDRTA